jgi:ppGpp synthetase/RelA/SpoT-type nucleotidyltranferase
MLAGVDLEDLRVRYQRARKHYDTLVKIVVEQLETSVRLAGVSPAAIEGRSKDISSLVKKAMRKSYERPWDQIRDKAGVRVTTTSEDEIASIEEVIRGEFEVLHYEDKRVLVDPKTFDYLGVHFEVKVDVDLELDEVDRICEIQVRTGAQTAWANMAHDLLYKAPVEPSPPLQRSLYRLVALVELFDSEVRRTKKAIMEEPGYNTGLLLAELEGEFLRLTARQSDPELSRLVADALTPVLPLGEWEQYRTVLSTFVEENEDKLRRIYDDYLEDDRNPLISQPESLLVFERLEHDRHHLVERWHDVLPESLIQSMGEIWGVSVDVDDG